MSVFFEIDEDTIEEEYFQEEWESESLAEIPVKQVKISYLDAEPVKIYLNQIGVYPLLTFDEEIEYSKIIANYKIVLKKSDELSKALQTPPSTSILCKALKITTSELKKIEFEAQVASKKLTQSNLRLVVSVAKKYTNQTLSFLDLVQEGNLGLIKATIKYDYTKGYRFSTYATWWIRQAITRSIAEQARTIRLPVHVIEAISKMRKVYRDLTQELARNPTEQEMATRMKCSLKKLRELKKLKQESISLTCTVNQESDHTLEESIEDKNSLTPFHYVMYETQKNDVEKMLSFLNDKEQTILRMRYGLHNGEQHSLEQIGKEFHVSRERIRQIEASALRKLRSNSKVKALISHIKD